MGFVKTIDICTVAHNCHGKSKSLTAKANSLTAKANLLTAKANRSRQKQIHSWQKQIMDSVVVNVHYNNNTDQKKPKEEAIFMTVFSQDWLHMQEQV